MLGKLYIGKDWHKSLGEIEFAINNTVNKTTGKIPSELFIVRSQAARTCYQYIKRIHYRSG